MSRGRPHKCPYEGCGSTNTVSKGARKTKSKGLRRIRLCKGCGRKFTPKNQKTAEFEDIQTEPAQDETVDVVEPEDSMVPNNEKPDLIESQLPEQ
jgi:transcriptional regulator NrdR family protein